ncbi:CobB/CobQ-like glutamine amidotransferase domain-containing protein [Pseudomassariella vexata]|uniref:Phosphoribosylformylglycinamidine synthase n=1 Tax=Pseudomassariella vexata TaxID=1141098 RepID=A0A1Y2DDS8_9PEZI|nr:CobB/CobQ-like glutamine amidotransferase domain-containing protein [Pseudomassariella vexata]ORY57276.1 CobB/CobQ-like glutamine amidotransferase domain-domain-containing protein [Pseudomassariella vexata]
MPHETLLGSSCYTRSQTQELIERVNKQNTGAKAKQISGQWIYYVDLKTSNKDGLDQVKDLIDVVVLANPPENASNSINIYITPRYISPWSSKATSIAHVCGLQDHVLRIERGRLVTLEFEEEGEQDLSFRDMLHDRMTETFSSDPPHLETIFSEGSPAPLIVVDIFADPEKRDPVTVLQEYNQSKGLGLDKSEMQFLVEEYTKLGRSPHDIELFMFAQVNSEHCRHKVFNSQWTIDGVRQNRSLFEMIKNTHEKTPDYTVSAYSDNAAVFQGEVGNFWSPDYSTGSYRLQKETVHITGKVETHNHPTAISPFPGAATGAGGEIRDEGAVGRGSSTKAGLCGFFVSDLLIPGNKEPWELDVGRPAHYASSLDIMLEGPIGSARFNNEFGRPCLSGCFRTLLTPETNEESAVGKWRGYHKPIMIAGGVGTVRPQHAIKEPRVVGEGAHVIVLGGPAMLIGLGGGAASSNASGEGNADLDFDSVQRGNPEQERRAQMVIDTCVALGDENPIAMIHDVGAGGLSNALPELVKDAGYGGKFELRQVESSDKRMSPLEIWCNEAQERYVLLINHGGLNRFARICERERCGYSNVGTVTTKDADGAYKLIVTDNISKEHPRPIDLPMDTLFPPKRTLEHNVSSKKPNLAPFDTAASLRTAFGDQMGDSDVFKKAVQRVFSMPAVGSKSFLITIGDRSVGGLTVRDQMVGPWQTPVADVAVTATSFNVGGRAKTGEAMAMGEKPTLALIDAAASARMAVAESLLNLGAADILGDLRRVKLSANWMAAVNHGQEGVALYEAVKAIGIGMLPELEISVPVGKDSTSMKASWKDDDGAKSVTAPVSVVISAFTVVRDVRSTWTPQLRLDVGETILLWVDLAAGRKAMGGSALAQSFGQIGHEAPDVRSVSLITDYFDALSQLHESGIVLAYHDRSDGGLITTLAEMMFAGRCGVDVMLDGISKSSNLADMTEALFNEELGAVFQVRASDEVNFKRCFSTCGPPPGLIRKFGVVKSRSKQTLTIRYGATPFVNLDRAEMQQWWTKTSFEMQKLRDNPASAESEYATISDSNDPGLSFNLTFSPSENILPMSASITGFFGKVPRIAILREQGVNSAKEMAFAFKAAGFDPVDVHMTDIIAGRSLAEFSGLAACGGFSFGDVLGAGQGWAKSILMHQNARHEFAEFFKRPNTFTLGVCNGCQMLSRLSELIPGTQHWPAFVENTSRQFEARYSMVKIQDNPANPSVFLHGMDGSSLPIVVSHGEGRAEFSSPNSLQELSESNMIPIRYVDNHLNTTEKYPFNPNGSPGAVAGVSSKDGRVLAMMPHPERTIMADVGSYLPPAETLEEWGEFGPWVRMFKSARRWIG